MAFRKRKRKLWKMAICVLVVSLVFMTGVIPAMADEPVAVTETVETINEGNEENAAESIDEMTDITEEPIETTEEITEITDETIANEKVESDEDLTEADEISMALEEPELFAEADTAAMPVLTTAAATGTFWSDSAWGDGDILFYGSVYGMTLPAYCIDHGLSRPWGTYTGISGYTSSVIGYIMKNGYPNTDWGLSGPEAQYLTQVAVYGAMGVDLYNIAEGMMPPVYIYEVCWGNGNFNIGVNLLAEAQAYATEADQAYASFWTPDNGVSQRVVVPVPTASLTVTKTTSATGSCRDQLVGNSMYSQDFSGAEFSVRIYDVNSGTWGAASTYTTGTDGTFTITGLAAGCRAEVTETKAPKGYVIPKTATQTVTLSKGANSLTFADDPTFDPATPVIYKVKYVNGVMVKEPVEGAVFKMEYFDNTARSGSAKRTWYFRTDSEGTFEYTPTWLAPGYASDSLYIDKNGIYEIPLGSVRFTEVESPVGYARYEGTLEGTVTQNSATGYAEFAWVTGSDSRVSVENGMIYLAETEIVIAVDKIDSGTGEALKGAVMQLTENGSVLTEWTTDGTTHEIKNILAAGHTYTIHEKSAPEGYKLAGDIEFTVDAKGNITVLSENAGTYTNANGYLTVKMADVKMIVLPLTGSDEMTWLIILSVILIGGGVAVIVYNRNRHGGTGGPKGGAAGLLKHKKAEGMAHECGTALGVADNHAKTTGVVNKTRRIVGVVIGISASLVMAVPAFAQGNIDVVQRGGQVINYEAYLLVSGTYENGALWNVSLADDISENTWKEAGIPEDIIGNAKYTAQWLAGKIETDDGSFVKKLAELVKNDPSVEPNYTFKSGDKMEVEDGYYLVVSDETYPMLFLTGGGETQSIYEKLVPKDNPKTGDDENYETYIWICIAGILIMGACLFYILRKEAKQDRESREQLGRIKIQGGKKEGNEENDD